MKGELHPFLKKVNRALLPLAGFGAFVWFLIRVVPKPSRARYPCMKAAAPLASAFVVSLLGFVGSAAGIKLARAYWRRSRYALGALCLAAAAAVGVASSGIATTWASGANESIDVNAPNTPMGQGQGIFPGRVVWVHDPDATNENYANNSRGALWFDAANVDQAIITAMLSRGLQNLTGTASIEAAWDALFRDFNRKRGRGGDGYRSGEKIAIKINLNGMGNGQWNINTSPQVCVAVLDQLVNTVGLKEDDIYLGDPNIEVDPLMYRTILEAFPDVHYWGRTAGRTMPVGTMKDVLFASDCRTSDPLPQAYIDSSYLINIPVLKKHHRAGISLTAKNHFGSVTPYNRNGAFNWHYSLPVPDGSAKNTNGKYGVYRCLVDLMGHEQLGGKTLLYLVDGLWSSINWGHPAIKWRMSPFKADWPSSLFLSQDPVAIDSVGYDLLRTEFDAKHPTEGRYDPKDDSGPFAQYKGIDDYLHQAADSANWPEGFTYDPERDGTPLPSSLGVHEHWNNAVDRQYSRNLGKDAGIELIYIR